MKLISISVWGDSAIYWEDALANVRLAQDVYPDWQVRIFGGERNRWTSTRDAAGAEVFDRASRPT